MKKAKLILSALGALCLMLSADSLLAREDVVAIFEATGSRDPGTSCVDDPDALDGRALYFPASDRSYYGWYSLHTQRSVTAGEYEIRFRLKVEDNTCKDPIFHVYGGERHFQIKGADFKAPNAYQEFTIPYPMAPGQWKATIRSDLRKLAGPPAWVDRITIVRKRAFSESETLAAGGSERLSDPRLQPHDGIRVWFVKGLYYQHYRILEALKAIDAKVDFAWTPRPPSGLDGVGLDGTSKVLTGEAAAKKELADALKEAQSLRPAESLDLLAGADDLSDLQLESKEVIAARRKARERDERYAHALSYDLIVLCNVEADNLSLSQRALIQDAVKAGAGLLLIGGPFAFGRGEWDSSGILSDLLPLTPAGPRDLRSLPAFAPLSSREGGILGPIPTAEPLPRALWIHRGEPKPDSMIELAADGIPVLLVRQYGRGRIAMLAGTVLGEPPSGETAFWDWREWPGMMEKVLRWLLPSETW